MQWQGIITLFIFQLYNNCNWECGNFWRWLGLHSGLCSIYSSPHSPIVDDFQISAWIMWCNMLGVEKQFFNIHQGEVPLAFECVFMPSCFDCLSIFNNLPLTPCISINRINREGSLYVAAWNGTPVEKINPSIKDEVPLWKWKVFYNKRERDKISFKSTSMSISETPHLEYRLRDSTYDETGQEKMS